MHASRLQGALLRTPSSIRQNFKQYAWKLQAGLLRAPSSTPQNYKQDPSEISIRSTQSFKQVCLDNKQDEELEEEELKVSG